MPEDTGADAPETPDIPEGADAPEGTEAAEDWRSDPEKAIAYAEKMAKENKEYREKWQPIERTFAGDETKPFLAAAQALADGNTDAVSQWVVMNAAAALGVEPDVLLALAEEGEFDDDEDADDIEATVERLVNERIEERFAAQEQSQIEAQREAIFEDLEEMGYKAGTVEANTILWFALNETSGDLDAAKEAFESFRKKPVDDYVESKRQQAGSSIRQRQGQTPSTERKIKLEDAADAAMEYLEQQA